MMRWIAWVLIICIWMPVVWAEESFQALFQQANTHYQAGDIQAARDLYSAMVDQGCRNAKVYYNLGTCYLNLGDVGRAILFLRKADRLAPRDEDIQANLAIARSLVKKPVEPGAAGVFQSILVSLHTKLKFWETAALAVVIYIFAIGTAVAAVLASRRRTKRRLFRTSIVLLLLLLVTGSSLLLKIREFERSRSAVAVAGGIAARSGPGDHFEEVFTQQAGYEMIILRQQTGWLEVRLPNGYTGWVPGETIRRI